MAKREVRVKPVVIISIGSQQATQVLLFEDDDMIEALSTDRPDEPFNARILPGRAGRRWAVPDPHRSKPFAEKFAIGSIAVSNEISGRRVPRKCFRDLVGDPLGGRVCRDTDMSEPAAAVSRYYEAEQDPKVDRRNDGEVDRCDAIRMVSQESLP